MTNMDALKCLSEKIRSVNDSVSGTADSLIKAQDALIEANKAFMALLESEERGGWIPVTEQLPKDEQDVLVTVHFKGLTTKYKNGWNDHIKPSFYVEVARRMDDEWNSDSDEFKIARNKHEVVAWMPLPKPYFGTWKVKKNDE